MCVFCAAIPLTASVGMHLSARQKAARQAAVERGDRLPQPLLPAGKATTLAVAGLLVGSMVYHTAIMPRIGASV